MNLLITGWHKLQYNYVRALYDSCLDEDTRIKLMRRIEYHEYKLNLVRART